MICSTYRLAVVVSSTWIEIQLITRLRFAVNILQLALIHNNSRAARCTTVGGLVHSFPPHHDEKASANAHWAHCYAVSRGAAFGRIA